VLSDTPVNSAICGWVFVTSQKLLAERRAAGGQL
jgi:hypothetical protein